MTARRHHHRRTRLLAGLGDEGAPAAGPAPAAERLARAQLREDRMRDELFWRPWLAHDMELRGAEHLRPGTGQILAGLHLGPMAMLQHALATRAPLHVSRFQAAADAPRQTDLYTVRKVARLEAAGATMVPRGGSFAVLRDVLADGGTVWLAIDAPGSRPTPLLGRTVALGTGIAALAFATGSEVVPAYALRERHRAVGVLGSPLAPAAFADPAALHAHLAAHADTTLRRHLPQALPEVFLLVGWR